MTSKVRAEVGDNTRLDVLRSVCAVAYLPIGEGWGMVCATIEKPARIAGGFVMVPVAWLMGAWRACQTTPLGIGDFRMLLAAREMAARRGTLLDGREPAYGLAELARLLGVTTKRARTSLRRLEAAGLIVWSEEAIEFPEVLKEDPEHLSDTIGGGKGSLAIPRRMLRFLANGARPALIATTLGILLRCLSRRKGGWDGRGRVKASWIARTFGVDERRVKHARKELVALVWIRAEADGQRAMNRWGRAFRINLAWNRVRPGGRSLPPLPAESRPATVTPSVDPEPLPERDENQEPACRGGLDGGTGFQVSGSGKAGTTPVEPLPVMLTDAQASPGTCSEPTSLPAPKLADVRVEDLKDMGRLLDLYQQAVAKGLVTASEADRLRFVGAAEHALAIATNPAALFAWLVLNGCWRYVTQADEDRASSRLKVHDRGPEPAAPGSEVDAGSPIQAKGLRRFEGVDVDHLPSMGQGLSEDARLVKAIREATIRAGVFRDPFPSVQARDPSWTRARWDAALCELGLA